MREILPCSLWLGNAGDGRDPERLLRAGVVAVINLAAEEPSPVLPRSMIYCHFPIMDGAQEGQAVLAVAIQTVVCLLKSQVPALVYCGAGMSRSPAIVAAALSIVQGGSPEERLREVVAGHPHDVSPHLWNAFSGATVSCLPLREWCDSTRPKTLPNRYSQIRQIPITTSMMNKIVNTCCRCTVAREASPSLGPGIHGNP